LHKKKCFLSEEEFAVAFKEHKANNFSNKLLNPHGSMTIDYKVFNQNNKPILFETYHFDSLGSFLYFDFFRGIKSNYIPKKCANCGRYFLLSAGKYSEYCEASLKEDKTKTCRDIGSRKKYDDKCKTDPIWQTYNRAYKAHYARLMKKKMANSEFEKWSRYAVELREKALVGKIDYDVYYIEIRK
jgi:hypothetical protein